MTLEPIFQPMDELKPEEWYVFQAHYGTNISQQQIIEKVYGGYPLFNLYRAVEFDATEKQLKQRRVTISLVPSSRYAKPLRLHDVSMKQFLVSGLPKDEWLPWDGENNWHKLDPQYRLELCHSEISRWSIVFKRNGTIQGGAVIEGHEVYSHIELVNNCTTTEGFEFKLVHNGILYHGSFGEKKNLAAIYTKLSQWQAGSLAWQRDSLVPGSSGPIFLKDTYWNPLKPDKNIPIDLTRYREVDKSVSVKECTVSPYLGEIDYYRWGVGVEYDQKPLERRLIHSLIYNDGKNGMPTKEPPLNYIDIERAIAIFLPNFQHTGIYDLGDPQKKENYAVFYKIDKCLVRTLSDSRFELDLRPSEVSETYGFRRLVIGNIDLDAIPVYPAFLTLHRFGFGARDTVMDYDPEFVPPSDAKPTPHYAYLLGGSASPDEANTYIIPEGFGIERAILSWKDYKRTDLVIDLISFERILPIWQGTIIAIQ